MLKFVKTNAMIKNYKYVSPFRVLISFHKIIESLEAIALSDIDYRSNYAKGLLAQIQNKTEFREGIDQLSFLDENEELIHYLLADLFPTALTHNEIKAATLPFYDITFNYSERFKKILNEAQGSFDIRIRDMEEHQFYIMNCILILNRYYHQNIDFGKPLFYDIPDAKGILKHYRILYNGDFLEILPTERTVFLTQSQIEELIDHYDDLDLWKKAFPEDSWILKGFAIVSLVDVTVESAVSNLKSNLLKSDVHEEQHYDSFESIFRSVFKIPDLKIGFTFYNEEEDRFTKPPFRDENLKSFILLDEKEADCKNVLCGGSYENLIENNQPYVIPNVTEYASQQHGNDRFSQHLLHEGVQSFLLAPVTKDGKLLGLIELASSSVRALNSINVHKLDLLLPYLSDTIEKYSIDMMHQMEAIIQKEYTSIHPSVYWKFKKEARNYLYFKNPLEEYNFKEIVFKEVYPLYGQIDIKGSSENRINAIVTDLKAQIHHIIRLIDVLNSDKKISVIDQKKFELGHFLEELDQPFKNDLEQNIYHYIETEIHPLLKHSGLNKSSKSVINDYFSKIDEKTGMFYQTRKDFEDSIMAINKKMAAILDAEQLAAQEIFPHYYERFKTDGVEHNLYIGASIEPNEEFSLMYLHNLRLWQLETLCEMEIEHHKIKKTLPCALDVTSLILAFSTPISIRFRMDEKRFDVDGSYNARYEVVKKRIDKALVKNSNERITQQGKITIVYSNASEEKEYLKYIKFLQHKDKLEATIEKLEVEDLQSVSGLKALRVQVKHDDSDLILEAEKFITQLLQERLDGKFSYHNLQHTKDVVAAIETLCKAEQVEETATKALLLAGWFHDAGYVECSENHEQRSVSLAQEFLSSKKATVSLQEMVSRLILATQYHHVPESPLEAIIKDADYVHLANENYPETLERLRKEWEHDIDKKYCNFDWFTLNIEFLEQHHYYTTYAQKHWQRLKEQNLKIIAAQLQNQ